MWTWHIPASVVLGLLVPCTASSQDQTSVLLGASIGHFTFNDRVDPSPPGGPAFELLATAQRGLYALTAGVHRGSHTVSRLVGGRPRPSDVTLDYIFIEPKYWLSRSREMGSVRLVPFVAVRGMWSRWSGELTHPFTPQVNLVAGDHVGFGMVTGITFWFWPSVPVELRFSYTRLGLSYEDSGFGSAFPGGIAFAANQFGLAAATSVRLARL